MLSPELDQHINLTVDEFAKIFRISRASVYNAIEKKEIPSIKIGNRRVIPRAVAEALLKQGSAAR